MRVPLILFFLSFISFVAKAQPQFSGWLASFNTFRIDNKKSIHADFQLRSTGEWQQLQTLLLRTGMNFHLSKKLVLTAGYAFISNRRSVGAVSGYSPEHRIWEQVLLNHSLQPLLISHRFRLEQRFIGKPVPVNNELKNQGTAYANRFRYFVRGLLPFKKTPAFKKGAFAALQNEIFLNFGNTSTVNGKSFDQNRLYLALGYRFQAAIDLEAGYLNQYTSGRGSLFTNNHIIQLAAYLRL